MSVTLEHSVFAHLEPANVWAHFATLCAIPRASKNEGRLRDTLKAWAEVAACWLRSTLPGT